jgi:hypothetical protein
MITATQLRDMFDYSPETGVFTRKHTTGYRGRWKAGSAVTGTRDTSGRIQIRIDKVAYLAHRLVWLYLNGEWPTTGIDHKDGDPVNNRADNLRLATASQNAQNQRRAHAGNITNRLGVTWHRRDRVYQASIRAEGKLNYLGTFSCPDKAYEAYRSAKAELHPFGTLGGVT